MSVASTQPRPFEQTPRLSQRRDPQVVVEPGFPGSAGVLFLAVSAERRQDDGRQRRNLSDAPRHLESVHPGHLDINQRELGTRCARQFNGRGPPVGDEHLVPVHLQERAEHLGRILVVVHDQDAPGRRHDGRRAGRLGDDDGRVGGGQPDLELATLTRSEAVRLVFWLAILWRREQPPCGAGGATSDRMSRWLWSVSNR